jgi:hypothetical protein
MSCHHLELLHCSPQAGWEQAVTVLLHLKDDVTAPQQLPLDIQLGVGGPLRVLLQPLPHLFICQYIKGVEGHFNGSEGRHHLLAEPTSGCIRIALRLPMHHFLFADASEDWALSAVSL